MAGVTRSWRPTETVSGLISWTEIGLVLGFKFLIQVGVLLVLCHTSNMCLGRTGRLGPESFFGNHVTWSSFDQTCFSSNLSMWYCLWEERRRDPIVFTLSCGHVQPRSDPLSLSQLRRCLAFLTQVTAKKCHLSVQWEEQQDQEVISVKPGLW